MNVSQVKLAAFNITLRETALNWESARQDDEFSDSSPYELIGQLTLQMLDIDGSPLSDERFFQRLKALPINMLLLEKILDVIDQHVTESLGELGVTE